MCPLIFITHMIHVHSGERASQCVLNVKPINSRHRRFRLNHMWKYRRVMNISLQSRDQARFRQSKKCSAYKRTLMLLRLLFISLAQHMGGILVYPPAGNSGLRNEFYRDCCQYQTVLLYNSLPPVISEEFINSQSKGVYAEP